MIWYNRAILFLLGIYIYGTFREIFWNIDYSWMMYSLAALVVMALGYSVYLHIRRWQAGRPAGLSHDVSARFRSFSPLPCF
jgi:hypothetical protein